MPGAGYTEYVGELAGGHLNADASKESDQHGAGKEIRQEPEPGQPGKRQHHAGKQGREPGRRTYRSDPATARPVSEAASMAAVSESPATTR